MTISYGWIYFLDLDYPSYFRIVSLSVFFFNLLPIKSLDGVEVIYACLCIISSRLYERSVRYGAELIDLETGGVTNREPEDPFWQRRAQRGQLICEKCTRLLLGLFIFTATLSFILGS
jgi:membrane-associated protease RseP (regulator of RpoE activity)